MSGFQDLFLKQAILGNLTVAGYTEPTPIQKTAIPLLLEGHDLLGIAQTGTGKTAAFSLPIIQKLLDHPLKKASGQPRVLILAPTRELCSQIFESMNDYSKGMDIRSVAIYGGVGQKEQVNALKSGVDVVVATPGRLLDLLEQKQLRLTKVEILVLDEADRMLDMGFLDEIKDIIRRLPGERQNMLFSATMPEGISHLARKLLKNPKRVEIKRETSTNPEISQKVIHCKRDHKFQLLKKIIKEEEIKLAIVFTRTKNLADQVVAYLAQNRIPSRALHGDKGQFEREKALEDFKARAIRVLIATDIASRGIDIEGISHVINFDLPLETESYVHRIGRTARAGSQGEAITFCDAQEKALLEKIQEFIGMTLPAEKFEGKFEPLRLEAAVAKKVQKPTPGKSQEKSAYLDHSKRQRPLEEGQKRTHPGFKKTKKRRK